jgi:hypothetical protein
MEKFKALKLVFACPTRMEPVERKDEHLDNLLELIVGCPLLGRSKLGIVSHPVVGLRGDLSNL